MNEPLDSSLHTVGEEWLTSYVAGGLSPAKCMIVACQAWMKPQLKYRLEQLDQVGGALLEGAEGAALSEGFTTRVFAALDAPATGHTTRDEIEDAPDWMPRPLRRFMKASNIHLKWRSASNGVARAMLWQGEDGERLYLMRVRGGVAMPLHSHQGEEWTLVLQGGYGADGESYAVGDVSQVDAGVRHAPHIDEGETCICLIADEGKLHFNKLLPRLMQSVIGI